LFEETRRDAERVLAADRDQRIQTGAGEVLLHLVDAAVELVRIRPRRADDRPAARKKTGDLTGAERFEDPFDELVPVRHHAAADGADHRVQAGTVAATGEDAYTHAAIVCANLQFALMDDW